MNQLQVKYIQELRISNKKLNQQEISIKKNDIERDTRAANSTTRTDFHREW